MTLFFYHIGSKIWLNIKISGIFNSAHRELQFDVWQVIL